MRFKVKETNGAYENAQNVAGLLICWNKDFSYVNQIFTIIDTAEEIREIQNILNDELPDNIEIEILEN